MAYNFGRPFIFFGQMSLTSQIGGFLLLFSHASDYLIGLVGMAHARTDGKLIRRLADVQHCTRSNSLFFLGQQHFKHLLLASDHVLGQLGQKILTRQSVCIKLFQYLLSHS